MTTRPGLLAVLLALLLAACSPTGGTSVLRATATPLERESSPPSIGPSTPAATPAATPTPSPTPIPVPAKPTGTQFFSRWDNEGGREVTTFAVLWKTPRTKGVEIRVYGVKECLAAPAKMRPGAEGPCLVEHTALPSSMRTLLAKAPASQGSVTWTIRTDADYDLGYVGVAWGSDGTPYYAIVVAAYSESGHSIFTIADPGGWSCCDTY